MRADFFTEWDYENQQNNLWLRNGSCNQCGECCRGTITLIGKNNGDTRLGFDGTNEEGRWFERFPTEEPRRLVGVESIDRDKDPGFEELCYELCHKGALCKSYDERAFVCEIWPMSPQQVEPFDNCSYSFQLLRSWKLEDDEQGERIE